MTFDELWAIVPAVLSEMTSEFFRIGNEQFILDPTSQRSACLLLSMRATSLLRGLIDLLKVETFDSCDVLVRAFLETRGLIMTFRFDDDDARKQIQDWFKEKGKDTWQPSYKASEAFLASAGAQNLQLGRRWGLFSGLSHPTSQATLNSAAVIAARIVPYSRPDLIVATRQKQADYCSSVMTLFITSSFRLSGWIDLGLDVARMPFSEQFRTLAPDIVLPILEQNENEMRGRAR